MKLTKKQQAALTLSTKHKHSTDDVVRGYKMSIVFDNITRNAMFGKKDDIYEMPQEEKESYEYFIEQLLKHEKSSKKRQFAL